MHHFFVPELMAAAVLVKTIAFDQFLMISVAAAQKSTSPGSKCIIFSCPELMAAAVLVKTIVFDQVLIIFVAVFGVTRCG